MSPSPRQSIIVVTGPTCSGKSELALRIAESMNGEIVNADSVQVYRGLDVGSAKPPPSELLRVPHHLISIVEPDDSFDAGAFTERADDAIRSIACRGRAPVIAGGTGLYLSALLHGLVETAHAGADAVDELEQRWGLTGRSRNDRARALHRALAERDPVTAGALHPHDLQRVRRALGISLVHGGSLGALQRAHGRRDVRYRAFVIVLLPDRAALYRRIDERVTAMMSAGLLEEVRRLLDRYPRSVKALGALGYRQLSSHLAGEQPLEAAVESIRRDTRRFAKRQLTWWRHQPAKLGWREVRPDGVDAVATDARAPSEADERTAREDRSVGGVLRNFLQPEEHFRGDAVYFMPVQRFGFDEEVLSL